MKNIHILLRQNEVSVGLGRSKWAVCITKFKRNFFFVKIKSICKEEAMALVQAFYGLNLPSIVLDDDGRAVNIVY